MSNKIKDKILRGLLLIYILVVYGCSKYLDAKPDKTLAVPASLKDLQALLDYFPRMNTRDPNSGIISADNYYLTQKGFENVSEKERRMYTWQKDFLFENSFNDWSNTFNTVYYANTTLEKINKIDRTEKNKDTWDDIKGQAYFFRAKSFLQAAFIWAKAYDSSTAKQDLGIPLRLNTDFNQPSVRSTVQQTYDQIIKDLKRAIPLLEIDPVHVMRPSKPAAYALLARTYISMRDYRMAAPYADSCLQLYDTLINYNDLSTGATFPISRFNMEVIFESKLSGSKPLRNSVARIDSNLYYSYQESDLRRKIFFKENEDGSHAFKGSYEGSSSLFSGIATDEVLLMAAECQARIGNTESALSALNELLKNRYEKGFIPISESNPQKVLDIILAERRKELLMRGLRWIDLKRLNKEGRSITLRRNVDGKIFVLPSNDLRYVLPIPEDIIKLSGMKQNPR